ncbi:kinase-like domain-containing protein [Rhizophagus irregularis DAOM 181602=DAOM 197198]|nr:kinase-like domain-containing protein [Rhizophagus irregularis DAOM 181602=DAOM 197198]
MCGNEYTNILIQEMQLKIDSFDDTVFEWIPYNRFNDIKELETDKDDFVKVFSAVWMDGPLLYCKNECEYKRSCQNKKVTLKCLYNSQNIINEVKAYSIKKDDFLIYEIYEIYGLSQIPDTEIYILVLQCVCCERCEERYTNAYNESYGPLHWDENQYRRYQNKEVALKYLCGSQNFTNEFLNEVKIKVYLYSITRTDELLYQQNQVVILKCLYNSQNITNDFLNEVKSYSIRGIHFDSTRIYGISQHPDLKYYILVLEYLRCEKCCKQMPDGKGGFADVYSAIWMDGPLHYEDEYLRNRQKEVALKCLHNSKNISDEFLNEIKAYSIKEYNKTENILSVYGITQNPDTKDYIMVLDYAKDMGLSGKVDNTDKTSIYGVTPYIAPEVLRGEPYTQAADIYSFSMIMYVVATGRQPFSNCAHDHYLVLDICKEEIRPSIIESEAPKCYIDLMKKCWDSNPNNRPNAIEIEELINLFYYSYSYDGSDFKEVMNIEKEEQHYDIKKQFKESEEYRKAFISSSEKNEKEISQTATHPEAIYTSRILDTLTKELHDECLDCEV